MMSNSEFPTKANETEVLGQHTFPKLTDGEITLAPFTLDDAETHLANDDEEQARWFGGESTPESVAKWIKRNQEYWQNEGPVFNFAIRDSEGQLIGMVEANIDNENLDGVEKDEANISYGLYPKARGKGYVGKAMALMETFLVEKGVKAAVIRVSPENKASLAVPVRLGYVGKGQITTKDGELLQVFVKELKNHKD